MTVKTRGCQLDDLRVILLAVHLTAREAAPRKVKHTVLFSHFECLFRSSQMVEFKVPCSLDCLAAPLALNH